MKTNFDLWFEKNFNEHGGGETTEDVARKAYNAGYDDGSMHNALDQAMRNGQLANERGECIKVLVSALEGADQALRKLQDFKKVHEACIGVIPQLVNEAIDLLTNKTAAVAGVPAVVDAAELHTEIRSLRVMLASAYSGHRLYDDDGELQDNSVLPYIDFRRDSIADIHRAMLARANATPSPLPQADMPRDATEGVMSATVDAAVSAYGSAPFDPQDADPHRTAIDSAVAAAERVRAGSTAVSAGEALRDRCARCGGSGFIDIGYGRHSECPHCHGIGSIARPAAPDMKSKDAVAPVIAPGETFIAGIKAAADWVRDRRWEHEKEHGYIESDTGALSYGSGSHANAKEEYNCELCEIEDGIRALSPPATTGSGGQEAKGGVDMRDALAREELKEIGYHWDAHAYQWRNTAINNRVAVTDLRALIDGWRKEAADLATHYAAGQTLNRCSDDLEAAIEARHAPKQNRTPVSYRYKTSEAARWSRWLDMTIANEDYKKAVDEGWTLQFAYPVDAAMAQLTARASEEVK